MQAQASEQPCFKFHNFGFLQKRFITSTPIRKLVKFVCQFEADGRSGQEIVYNRFYTFQCFSGFLQFVEVELTFSNHSFF